MLEKIVTLYRKAEMDLMSSLSGVSTNVLEETSFYDVGSMQTRISRIQKELKRITKELEISLELKDMSDYGKKQRTELLQQREQLLFQMIFLASNSFSNLEDCVQMAAGHKFAFMQCVTALQEYQRGQKKQAFSLLEDYYRKYGSVEDHYLINKVFGLLLAEQGKYKKASMFLNYALQFIPDDTECLQVFATCYRQLREIDKESIIQEVLDVLG